MRLRRFFTFAGLAALLLAPATTRAQLLFTFVGSPTVAGTPGATLNFFADLNNVSGGNITLQGFNPGLSVVGLTVDDLFFTNVPDPLPAGPGPAGGYNLFTVTIDPFVLPGTYTGTARIDYDTAAAPGQFVTQGFAVEVQPLAGGDVPEPGTCPLVAAGLLLLAGTIRSRTHGRQGRT